MQFELPFEVKSNIDAVLGLFTQDTAYRLVHIFDHIFIAEDCIAEGERTYPDRAAVIHNSFSLLCPPRDINLLDVRVYRSYAMELVDRIGQKVSKENWHKATAAEVMFALSEMSRIAQLQSNYAYAYMKLFVDIIGGLPFAIGLAEEDYRLHESYKGAIDEIIYELRKRCRVERKWYES